MSYIAFAAAPLTQEGHSAASSTTSTGGSSASSSRIATATRFGGSGSFLERLQAQTADPSQWPGYQSRYQETVPTEEGRGELANLSLSRAHSSAGERPLHTREVPGSIPGAPMGDTVTERAAQRPGAPCRPRPR